MNAFLALADVFKHVYWGFFSRSDDFCNVSQAVLLRSIRLQLVDSSLLEQHIFVEGLDKQGFAPGGVVPRPNNVWLKRTP